MFIFPVPFYFLSWSVGLLFEAMSLQSLRQQRQQQLEDQQRRQRRKRAYHEYEEMSMIPTASTYTVPGTQFQLRSATHILPVDEIEDIPPPSLREAAVAHQRETINVTEATACPTFIPFGAQTARADQETLRALVQFGYTADIEWKRLSLPERLCIVESLLRFPTMPAFDVSAFMSSLDVFQFHSPSELFALYVFVAEGLLNQLAERTQSMNMESEVTSNKLLYATEQMLTGGVSKAIELLALGYERWHTNDNGLVLYHRLVEHMALILSQQCLIAPDVMLQFLNLLETDAFAPALTAYYRQKQQQQQQPSLVQNRVGHTDSIAQLVLEYPRTRELTTQLSIECSADRVQQRRVAQIVQFSMEQAIQYALQIPFVQVFAIVTPDQSNNNNSTVQRQQSSPTMIGNSSNYNNTANVNIVPIQQGTPLPINWEYVVLRMTEPNLSTQEACQRATQIISQTLTPWMWQQFVPADRPIFSFLPDMIGYPAMVSNRQQSMAIISDDIHNALKDYLFGLMTNQNVSQMVMVRAQRHVQFLTAQWKQSHCRQRISIRYVEPSSSATTTLPETMQV